MSARRVFSHKSVLRRQVVLKLHRAPVHANLRISPQALLRHNPGINRRDILWFRTMSHVIPDAAKASFICLSLSSE